MTPAISSGSPKRLRGLASSSSAVPPNFSIKPEANLLGKNPGATIFAVIFLGPSSIARFFPKCFIMSAVVKAFGRGDRHERLLLKRRT
jgi:hypothetical protein